MVTIFIWNVYFWEQARVGEGAEREGDTESEAVYRLWAVSTKCSVGGAWTHEPWDHDLSQSRTLNWLGHPGAPAVDIFDNLPPNSFPTFVELVQFLFTPLLPSNFFYFMFFLLLRETEQAHVSAWAGEGQREGDRES